MPISTQMIGLVFNIQKFSLNDGPGIRDMVFLKGCPLRCPWCSNPESQQLEPEILFRPEQCLGPDICGLCISACPEGAVQIIEKDQIFAKDQGVNSSSRSNLDLDPNSDSDSNLDMASNSHRSAVLTMDWTRCTHCGECTKDCPGGARERVGREMTVDEVIAIVEKDGGFHARSGGGVTVSGGEPLLQADFVGALLKSCKARLIDTAVETTGFGSWENLKTTVEHANQVFFDIKCADSALHKKHTGVPNEIILQNLKRLSREMPHLPVIVRTPVIPGFNDTEEAISHIREIVVSIPSVKAFQLLPFHRLGIAKYAYQGKECEYIDAEPPGEEQMAQLKIFEYAHD